MIGYSILVHTYDIYDLFDSYLSTLQLIISIYLRQDKPSISFILTISPVLPFTNFPTPKRPTSTPCNIYLLPKQQSKSDSIQSYKQSISDLLRAITDPSEKRNDIMHKMIRLPSSPLLRQVVHKEMQFDICTLCCKVKGVFDFAEYGKEEKGEEVVQGRVYELDQKYNHQKELKFDLKLDEFFDDGLIIIVFLMEYCIYFADIAEHKRHVEHKLLLWIEIHPQHVAHLMYQFAVFEFRTYLDVYVHVKRGVVCDGEQR